MNRTTILNGYYEGTDVTKMSVQMIQDIRDHPDYEIKVYTIEPGYGYPTDGKPFVEYTGTLTLIKRDQE